MILTVDENDNIRIDKYISDTVPDISRSYIQKLFGDGQVRVNNLKTKQSYRVAEGDIISIDFPDITEPEILPENIPIDIVYEDKDVIVINKAKGMVVHPAPGHYSGTLVNALMYHCGQSLSGINGVTRPGIVHRIDMDTSGLLLVAKNDKAHAILSEQLKDHSIKRKYLAIVSGSFNEESGRVSGNIGRHPTDRKKMAVLNNGGKTAVTNYYVLKRFDRYSLIECILETGRTHQIRVHMSHIGHPLLGDTVYGNSNIPLALKDVPISGQCLHAQTIGFIHPNGEYMEFSSRPPDYFEDILNILNT